MRQRKNIKPKQIIITSLLTTLALAGINYIEGCTPTREYHQISKETQLKREYLDGMLGPDGLYRELNSLSSH